MDSRQREFEDLKYEYEKAVRFKDSLKKNLERRKKLNLDDEGYENDIKGEIEDMDYKIKDMHSRLRKIQSEVARSRVIAETNEKSPWEK